ncbi:hypothetical protein [Escherichia coli]|uniref:hypothetical protein n=1 Tax=Escherichia coli TaxID=562 RepID=UPI001CD9304B|nr:hypothetical protein [Escherichia coli]MCA2075052.1 hypothetical protein [Escherichia coli]
MTWTRKTISVSADMPPLSCSVIPVTPWTYGLGRYEESGVYLSPPNAINWLAGKMAGSRASGDVTIIMIAENTHDLFIQSMAALTAVLPVPVFTQAQRMAQAAASLSTDKMQIPITTDTLPAPVHLSVATMRSAVSAARAAQARQLAAQRPDAAGLRRQISRFISRRAGALAGLEEGLRTLAEQKAQAWVFQYRGYHRAAAAAMVKDIPAPTAVHTVAALLAADSLTELGKMIHEPDRTARP